MDVTQATALLTVCAAFDNRKPDPDTAHAWAVALEGYDFADSRQAIIEHYRADHRWIMPSDVIKGVKRIEADRFAASPLPETLTPPASITCLDGPEFDAAYLSWLKEQTHRIRRGLPLVTAPAIEAGDDRDVKELVESLAATFRAS